MIMADNYQICTRCVMDTTDPELTFDEHGVCSRCNHYDQVRALRGYRKGISEKELERTVSVIRENSRDRDYDCLVGLSGGVDSAYMLYLAHKLGLRILAVHVDSGWNTKVAEKNIQRMCEKLNIQLHVWKMDWPTMKELQRAYMLSGVANLDVPQDHLFCSAVFAMARQFGVKYILNGSNIATEGASAPFSLQHSYRDTWHMKSIYKKHGRGMSLEKYPFLSLHDSWLGPRGITKINLLDMVDYSKKGAMELLSREFGWEYYGGKHYESVLTRYLQCAYQPAKFHFDKRRSHLSCLVLGGEMTREEALRELEQPPCPPEQQQADEEEILTRLELSKEEWHKILASPPTPDDAYFSQQKLFDLVQRTLGKERLDRLKKRIYTAK